MARRDARAFSFVFNEQQLAGPVRKVFSEQAVKQKLKLLKQELPAEIYAWPAHTPADEVEAMFPVYKLLSDAQGRQQAWALRTRAQVYLFIFKTFVYRFIRRLHSVELA